jgi:uncharacterized MAPEG superfamily protein
MTIPTWTLLAFAAWTLLMLMGGIGIYRWARILTGRVDIAEFRADHVEGLDWYKRAMRAHANSLESLPVYGAIVVALLAAGLDTPTLDWLALTLIGARVIHTFIHIGFVQTNTVASLRFAFFFVQVMCMIAMIGIVVAAAP